MKSNYKIAVVYTTQTFYKTITPPIKDPNVEYEIGEQIDENTIDDPHYAVLDGWDGEVVETFERYDEAETFIRYEEEK